MSRTIYLLIGIIVVGIGTSFLIIFSQDDPMSVLTGKRPYVEIHDPAGFVNSEPFKLEDYVGKKVILIDFMTYSCINCLRTFPYVVSWYEKYKDKGLIVVGIHTPEFAFEQNRENVEKALHEQGIYFPVVMDNSYGTWKAYGNNYWPRKYLIDIHGNIVYDHIGEGAYAEVEHTIRTELENRAEFLGETIDLGLATSKTETEARRGPRSPEIYFGAHKNEYLANGRPRATGLQRFVRPASVRKGDLYLDGAWNIQEEYMESTADSSIIYKYVGKELFLVATSEKPVRVRILQDGQPLIERGEDVDEEGYMTISEDRLYKVIKNRKTEEHTIEIQFSTPGVRIFAFTFG